jgi:acyl-CoA thioesterase FadM
MMREQRLTYRTIEESGYQMPVYEAFLQFKNPAFYDELLEVETRVEKMPQAKVHIDHTVRSKDRDIIIAEGVATDGLGLAVMNRLRKASGYNIVKTE